MPRGAPLPYRHAPAVLRDGEGAEEGEAAPIRLQDAEQDGGAALLA